MQLADAFIQSDLQAIHFVSMCVPWELNPQPFVLLELKSIKCHSHISSLFPQYVKSSSGLCQRARPKQEHVASVLEDRGDSLVSQVQQIPALKHEPGTVVPPCDPVEPEAAKAARLEARQWKELKVEYSDLPGIYARLSKIKLTGVICSKYFV